MHSANAKAPELVSRIKFEMIQFNVAESTITWGLRVLFPNDCAKPKAWGLLAATFKINFALRLLTRLTSMACYSPPYSNKPQS